MITNPVVFDEKDLDKLQEKQQEYVEKHYPIIVLERVVTI